MGTERVDVEALTHLLLPELEWKLRMGTWAKGVMTGMMVRETESHSHPRRKCLRRRKFPSVGIRDS